jgi:hypothetical protein
MAQMGHTDAKMALEVYARKMNRTRETGTRLDALVFGLPKPLPKPNGIDRIRPNPMSRRTTRHRYQTG